MKPLELVQKLSPDALEWILYELAFTTEDRQKMAKSGEAEPDGSYPIPDVDHLKKAIKAFGRSKNKAATKAHIRKRAKALGATNLIPQNWDEDGSDN